MVKIKCILVTPLLSRPSLERELFESLPFDAVCGDNAPLLRGLYASKMKKVHRVIFLSILSSFGNTVFISEYGRSISIRRAKLPIAARVSHQTHAFLVSFVLPLR